MIDRDRPERIAAVVARHALSAPLTGWDDVDVDEQPLAVMAALSCPHNLDMATEWHDDDFVSQFGVIPETVEQINDLMAVYDLRGCSCCGGRAEVVTNLMVWRFGQLTLDWDCPQIDEPGFVDYFGDRLNERDRADHAFYLQQTPQ